MIFFWSSRLFTDGLPNSSRKAVARYVGSRPRVVGLVRRSRFAISYRASRRARATSGFPSFPFLGICPCLTEVRPNPGLFGVVFVYAFAQDGRQRRPRLLVSCGLSSRSNGVSTVLIGFCLQRDRGFLSAVGTRVILSDGIAICPDFSQMLSRQARLRDTLEIAKLPQ